MAATDTKRELLRTIPLFAGLSGRELDRVEQLADTVDLPAGHVLMRQGETGREMFVIASGGVVVERDGREISRPGPGAVVGEIALIAEGPRTATVTTSSPSTMVVLGHREFHTLMEDSAEVRRCVHESLAKKIRFLELDKAH